MTKQVRKKAGQSQPLSKGIKSNTGNMLKAKSGMKSTAAKVGGKKGKGAPKKQRPYSQ